MNKNIKEALRTQTPLLLRTLLALLGTYGLCVLGRAMKITHPSFSILSVIFFTAIWFLLERTEQQLTRYSDPKAFRKHIFFAFIVSFLFSLSMLMGYQLQNNGMTESGFRGKGLLILHALCLSVAFFSFGSFFFQCVERIRPTVSASARKWKPSVIFAVSAIFVFLCMIPVWLAYYPIVMSYDFHRQVNEAYNGFAYFYPYQPIAHTWVIWVFLQLGTALGSLETGFACMSMFQIILYALITGYACSTLYRISYQKWLVIAAAAFFGLFPFNTVLVVCTTKDVLFTILFLLFFLLFLERFLLCQSNDTGKRTSILCKKSLLELLLVAEGCLMMQFRNNAFYAVAVFMILFIFLAAKKERLRVLLLCICLIAGGKLTGAAIKEAIGTQIGSATIEMFSVPLQQFARVGYYHADELDETTAQKLDSFIPKEHWSYYYPPLSDPIKSNANSESFEEIGSLLSFWIELGLKYPNEYIDAFLELTRGYWFLDDTSWAENLGSGVEGRMGAIFTYTSSEIPAIGSIEHDSKFPWLEAQLEEIVSGNSFYNWPIISLIFRSAFYPWCMLLITLTYLYLKQYKHVTLSLLIWLYLGTVLLGPVVQLRYVFPFMTFMPILAAMLWHKEDLSHTKPFHS